MIMSHDAMTSISWHGVMNLLVMVVPLQVLAVLSALGGFIGIPHLSWLEHWLEPVIPGHAVDSFSSFFRFWGNGMGPDGREHSPLRYRDLRGIQAVPEFRSCSMSSARSLRDS